MKHKYAYYPAAMSVCALLCFIAVLIVFGGVVQPLWGRMLLLFLPSLLLGTVAFFAAKGKLRAGATIAWTTVLSIVLFIASCYYGIFLFIWTATTQTTDTAYYRRAYAQIDERNGVEKVFPKSIPPDAEDVTFHYCPQFLQGGEEFELSYTTTDEKLTEWQALLENEADWIGPNRKWYIEHYGYFSGIDTVRYQLYWDGGDNHGEICYVLVDEDTGRITFCYSDW